MLTCVQLSTPPRYELIDLHLHDTELFVACFAHNLNSPEDDVVITISLQGEQQSAATCDLH